jgi:hypothetical protein
MFAAFSFAASAFTAAVAFATWNGSNEPGKTSVGASSLVKPTRPSLNPSKLNVFDGDHSAGVLPAASTTFAETYGNWASGISVFRR